MAGTGDENTIEINSAYNCLPPVYEQQVSSIDNNRSASLFLMTRWRGRVAVVTGASGGVGAATCKALVQNGMKVAGLARSLDVLEKLARDLEMEYNPGQLLPVQCNIAEESELMNAFKVVLDKWGGVDVLVNNAGLAINETLLNCTRDTMRYMTDVNVLGTCLATREAIKSMRERNVTDGHIININSIAGHSLPQETRGSDFYCATKFAVTAITEGLRRELRENNLSIRATSISPGLIKTGFMEKFLGPEIAEATFKQIDPLLPEDIADAILWIMSAPLRMEINDILMRPTAQKS